MRTRSRKKSWSTKGCEVDRRGRQFEYPEDTILGDLERLRDALLHLGSGIKCWLGLHEWRESKSMPQKVCRNCGARRGWFIR